MVAQFIAEEGILKGLVLTLDEGDEWTLGRDIDQCNLVVEDLTVSRRHLLCKKSDAGYTIENLSETHPVEVNGVPIVEPYLLQDGDKVQVGATIFRFYLDAPLMQEMLEGFPSEELEPEYDTLYEEEPLSPAEDESKVHLDLSVTSRFLLKVIAGPNTGAEFSLEPGNSYTLGTDSTTCDVIFHDLSVSREHARMVISKEGDITIEDLESRNGVMIEKERIVTRAQLLPNRVVTLGTTAFLVLDREAESATIASPIFAPPVLEEAKAEEAVPLAKTVETGAPALSKEARRPFSRGVLILSLSLMGLTILFGLGIVSLFQSQEIAKPPLDYAAEIKSALKLFPSVTYTYNPTTGKLFLVGHVLTGVKKNELLYNLRGLNFIKGIEDNVINDESIWQEQNLLLSQHPEFKGVAMHAAKAGQFVLTGYLQTEAQATNLTDYINMHFNYLSLLENRVVVEEEVMKQVMAELLQKGFGGVNVSFANGELMLTGYVSSTQVEKLKVLLATFEQIQGVRLIKNFVVAVSPEQGVVDLNKRYPGRYEVTGYSKHGNVNFNVVINGRILIRGDQLDGMTITSIQPTTVFLEKEGIKYRLSYKE